MIVASESRRKWTKRFQRKQGRISAVVFTPSCTSDASPLINLAHIRKLELLDELYGQIQIPDAVWHEVVIDGAGQPGAEEISRAKWIQRVSVTDRTLVQALRQDLDAGEAEAIALAIADKADLLLMDERLGRASALYFGLRCIGLIGVLVEAKHQGLITSVKTHLDALRDEAGFRISSTLYARVLHDQGEQSGRATAEKFTG